MNTHPKNRARVRELPYLFAYDIRSERRQRQVLKALRRWRVDGQLSLHETWLRPFQARELAAEVLELVDRDEDSLLLCRLSRRAAPVYHCHPPRKGPVLGRHRPTPLPARLSDGWYLVGYDIRDPKRLTRIQRRTAERTVFVQRSLYLYQGSGMGLAELLAGIGNEMDQRVDDLRAYTVAGPQDLWFLSGAVPPLPGLVPTEDAPPSLWRRLKRWFGG